MEKRLKFKFRWQGPPIINFDDLFDIINVFVIALFGFYILSLSIIRSKSKLALEEPKATITIYKSVTVSILLLGFNFELQFIKSID